MSWSRQQPPKITWPNPDLKTPPVIRGSGGEQVVRASLIKSDASGSAFPDTQTPVKLVKGGAEWRVLIHVDPPVPANSIGFVVAVLDGMFVTGQGSPYTPPFQSPWANDCSITLKSVKENWSPDLVTWATRPTSYGSITPTVARCNNSNLGIGGADTAAVADATATPDLENGSSMVVLANTNDSGLVYGYELSITYALGDSGNPDSTDFANATVAVTDVGVFIKA